MAAQSAQPQRSLSTPGTSRRLLIPLARVRFVSPFPRVRSVSLFPLRKDHSEAYAFADCFSSGSNFLPNGLLFFLRKERIFSAPPLFGDEAGIYSSICNLTPRFPLYYVELCENEWFSLEEEIQLTLWSFLSFRGFSPTLRLTPIPGQHHILPNRRKELKGSDWQGPGPPGTEWLLRVLRNQNKYKPTSSVFCELCSSFLSRCLDIQFQCASGGWSVQFNVGWSAILGKLKNTQVLLTC